MLFNVIHTYIVICVNLFPLTVGRLLYSMSCMCCHKQYRCALRD